MRRVQAVVARTAVAILIALGSTTLDRSASAADPSQAPPALQARSTAPISLLDEKPVPPAALGPQWLRMRVPGPSGTSVWGASLSLPFSLRAPLPHTGNHLPIPLRPTPELEIGVRSLGSATGGVVQLVSPGGVRFGGGLYFNKIAVGAPPAHQLMMVFQIPLP